MKWVFTLLLSCTFFPASAQLHGLLDYYLEFDKADHSWRQGIVKADTNFIHWVNIDTLHYPNNKWQIGKPNKIRFNAAYSNPNAIITDTTNVCIPNDTSVFILKVPKHAWLGLMFMSFKYKLDIDTGDIAKIEVSADTGLTWIDVVDDTTGSFLWDALRPKPDLSKSTINWDSAMISIRNGHMYLGADSFLFRFTFFTGNSVKPRDGWMIDNILMAYAGEAVFQLSKTDLFSIYPNPANRTFILHYELPAAEDISIRICNVLGQAFYLKKLQHATAGNLEVNTTNIPPGTYQVILQSDMHVITKSLIIAH